MPIEKQDMETATGFDQLRLMEVGKYKTGKSRVAATARKPILFIDTDLRRQAVAGIKGIYAVSIRDEAYPKQPVAYGEILDVLGQLERGMSLKEMGYSDSDERRVKTVVFDSAQTMSKACIRHALHQNSDIRREIVIAATKPGQKGTVIHLPGGWDGWMVDMAMMEELTLRAMGIPETDFILTIHEENEKVEGTGTGADNPEQFTGRFDMYPGRHRHLQKYFNEVWRLTRETTLPVAQLQPNWQFTAATNFNVKGAITNPNIEDMINFHINNPNEPQPNQTNVGASSRETEAVSGALKGIA